MGSPQLQVREKRNNIMRIAAQINSTDAWSKFVTLRSQGI
jgi:hypothetical protein